MKKVMYIHHGDVIGGAPRSLKFLLSRLDKTVYSPTVVCRANPNDTTFFEDDGIKTIYCKEIRPFNCSTVSGMTFKKAIYNFVYAPSTFFATKRLIRENNPSILHLNSTCLFMCAKAAKKVNPGIKVICHVREPLLKGWSGIIARYMCNKYCDRFVSIDEFDGRSVDRKLIKTNVVYNFVDLKEYSYTLQSNVLRDELSIPSDAIIFLVLARVTPSNGILEVIKKWKQSQIGKNRYLVIVGEKIGPKSPYMQKCHDEANGIDNIHILPFRSDVTKVIASSDIALCPFTEPHFARAIIECAAMGKPSLANWIDGPKELIKDGETGLFYYDEGKGPTFEEQVERLSIDKKLRALLGQNAIQFATACFNADINADKTFSVYQ